MGDPFFQSDPDPNKRKRPRRNHTSTNPKLSSKSKSKSKQSQPFNSEKQKQKPKKVLEDDVIESESDGNESDFNRNNDEDDGLEEEEEEEDFNETPAQKRLRLAQDYLNDLKQSQLREDGTFDAAEIDQEIISSRLQQDVLESSGRIHTYLGEKLSNKLNPITESSSTTTTNPSYQIFKTGRNHHRLPITCIKLSKDGNGLFVADKQGQIIQYDTSSLWKTNSNEAQDQNQRTKGLIKKICIMKNHIPKKQTEIEKFKKKQSSKNHKTLSKIEVGDQFGHLGEVLTIDISDDGTLLASGGKDKLLGVWDLTNQEKDGNLEIKKWKAGIRGHKDLISSVSFRSGTSTLYTASYDRMIKVYNLDSLTYSETLFGHQDQIQCISALNKETLVSAGGRDRTCRYWKILDESQLVFRGGGNSKLRDLIDGAGLDEDEEEDVEKVELRKKKVEESTRRFVEGSIDCVCMIDDHMFLSGGDSGSISLWSTHKKKAIFTQTLAHGTEKEIINEETQETIIKPRWITSISSLGFSDLFCSGSWDGNLKVWKLIKGKGKYEIRKFELIKEIGIGIGMINSIDMILHKRSNESDENGIIGIGVGIGQEHRLGRWKKIKEAKNVCCLILIEL
ncbi:WD40-repeat-containing domain protein [Melampsora americana]|nr:WD40-repeat-containing domain protein [Melampsora americana]